MSLIQSNLLGENSCSTLLIKFNDIKSICLKHKVKRFYVFGSVLTKSFKKNSDNDFIVDFQPLDLSNYANNHFEFKFALEDTLQRPIDLLEEKQLKIPILSRQ